MEKSKPHYTLADVQALIGDPATRIVTKSAADGAAALGLKRADIYRCVAALTMADFYKSMTMHFDHRRWQDVYRPTYRGLALYVKVQISEDQAGRKAVVISFKAL